MMEVEVILKGTTKVIAHLSHFQLFYILPLFHMIGKLSIQARNNVPRRPQNPLC